MKTTIDYLKFRTQSPPFEVFRAMSKPFGENAQFLVMGGEDKGVEGFTTRIVVKLVDVVAFSMDFGGESQRGWVRVTMTGASCLLVQDWAAMQDLVNRLDTAQLRRVDVALTTLEGEVTHESVLEAYTQGEFKGRGRNPKMTMIQGSDHWDGRTIYVGNRKGAKYLRAYEKGLEQARGLAETLRGLGAGSPYGVSMSMDGVEGMHLITNIYRVEVEFKAVDDTIIGWDVLDSSRDSYFVGAYPYCASLLPGVDAKRTQCDFPEQKTKLALIEQAAHCKRAYGGLLAAMKEVYGMERAWELLTAPEPSQMLVEAGIYMLKEKTH